MSVEQALDDYLDAAVWAAYHAKKCFFDRSWVPGSCLMNDHFWLEVDAASIVLDLAVAEDVARRSVAV